MISRDQVIRAFQDALGQHGIALADPSRIELDGNWHRARVEGDRGRAENLSYRIHFDDRPAGFFEDHKRGVTGTFSVKNGEDLSPAERQAAQARWRELQASREAEREHGYQQAAKAAGDALKAAGDATAEHPYLARKGLTPTPGLRIDDRGRLLIPVYSDLGIVASYQSIAADGEKLFMPGGRMAGSFHPIAGTDKSRVLVCEGYATGAALTRVTGHPTACAMSAGNLAAVVKKMRLLFPEREVVSCPDNDWATEQRTGKNPGLEAAADLYVRVIAPSFPADADPSHTDWDDWLRGYGTADELRALVNGPDAGQDEPVLPSEPQVDPPPFPEPVDRSAEIMPRTFRVNLQAVTEADDFVPVIYGESNIATRFAATVTSNLRHVDEWGSWMVWDGARWRSDRLRHALEASKRFCAHVSDVALKDGETFTTEKQRQAVASRYTEKRTIMNISDLAKSDPRIAASTDQWDADPWALNTPSGVVDLRNGYMRPAQRDDHMTKITRVSPGGACPAWHRFLATATAGDGELIAFLQRMAGYCLTGSTRDHALFFVYGTGGNGKGTFLNTLQWIIGDYAKSAPADMFTERKHEAHTTELARLMGARLVAAQETEEGKRWAEAKIKALTGGDPVTARFMRQNDFEFIPQFKLVMTGNHKPGLRNVDEAIKRRLHLIPFTVTIAPQDRDTGLAERLKAEAGGILQWAIEGCQSWLQGGLRPPAAVLAATDEYLEQQDTLGAWIEECCDLGIGTAKSSTLYASYKSWAERSGEFALPLKRWVAAMESRGMTSRKSSGVMVYEQIRVLTEEAGSRASRHDPNDFIL